LGGADDVMRMVDALERAELHWCAIGGIAVNHWAAEPMVTRDIDFVVADDTLAGKIKALRTPDRRPSKAIKDLGDIARLVEAHPRLTATLPPEVAVALDGT
jgi:hypothetical protein